MTEILVVRSGALGDTILTVPLLNSLRKFQPDSRVTFLGNRAYRSLLPPEISFQSIDGAEWLWLFSEDFCPPNIADKFQEAYVILNKPNVVVANLRKAGIKIVRHSRSKPRPGRHVVASMHEALGMPVPTRTHSLSYLAPTQSKDLIWLHPGSGGRLKCIPLENTISVAETLKVFTGWKLAVTAGEADAFLSGSPAWEQLIAGPGNRLYLHKPLMEICRELGAARLFIGNDSGISHLAAGLGVPSVVLFVSTDPVQWSPWAPEAMLKIMDLRSTNPDAGTITQGCLELINRNSLSRK